MTHEERSDLINERGKYAPTPEELFERLEDIFIPSFGEKATRTIARAWSRKAENSGYTARNRQFRLF